MPDAALRPPTLEYLLALKTEKAAEFAADDAQLDRMREVRTMTRPVALDDRFRLVDVEVRDPTIADEVQRVVATLSLNPPKLQVTPAFPGDQAETNATLRERWTEEVLRVAGQRLPGRDAFRDVVDAACGDGGAWCKLLFQADLWTERYRLSHPDPRTYDRLTEEAKKSAGPPFVWVSVDARTVYPVWAGGRLAEVLEATERPLHAALRQYRLGLDRRGALVPEEAGVPLSQVEASVRVPRHVTVLEHWDDTWVSYAVIAGGEAGQQRVVRQLRHGYGQAPYFFAPGFTFNWQHGRKVGWGVAESKRWLVEYRAYLLTLHAQVAARDAVPPLSREVPESASAALYGEDGKPSAATAGSSLERWDIRQVINLKPGEKLVPVQFPGAGQALKDELASVNEMIDGLLTPRVQSNVGSGLEGAGFAINQVLAEARIQQDPIAKHVQQMLGELTRFLWRLVREKVRETVWVGGGADGRGWLGAGPDDLADTVGIAWQLDPERPSTKLIEERYHHERVARGTEGRHQAIRAMGDNPDEVDDDRELDRIRQTAWYQCAFQNWMAPVQNHGPNWRRCKADSFAGGAGAKNAAPLRRRILSNTWRRCKAIRQTVARMQIGHLPVPRPADRGSAPRAAVGGARRRRAPVRPPQPTLGPASLTGGPASALPSASADRMWAVASYLKLSPGGALHYATSGFWPD